MVKDMLIQRDPKLVEWVRQATRHKRRMAERTGISTALPCHCGKIDLLELVTRMGSPSTTGDPVDPFDVSILRKQVKALHCTVLSSEGSLVWTRTKPSVH
ncbi:hypothetical protein AC1031_015357 [Aphanomyces cochlioides]|nr:hypothetical protein AC1031_015357 [Aphanomyces cochlioides]